ncbi:family 20 glycosylhydrolase [Sphingobacteruim zhuxiongii]|nr:MULTISPECIES: family 20 glycosylhydrolase [unclassified Sphingobacterium]
MPIESHWKSDRLNLAKGLRIEIMAEGLTYEKDLLNRFFEKNNIKKNDQSSISLTLQLNRDLQSSLGKEGYQLHIDQKGIHIDAATTTGIFYGIQTLSQFVLDKQSIQMATITDKPAFSWRAFLVDVGRNHQPMSMLKEQIDVMASYKLNVLHFHFTEDIAWRLASKKYPKLNAPDNITRWPNGSYSEEDFRELIAYCKERHILLLPEIDMPGHSEAFERYFGVNMQTEKGIEKIKELLQEFHETYPELKHLHIGGDEVKINNKNFMPEITRFVESLGYQTYGWDPGSNLENSTIRQLWMGKATAIAPNSQIKYIDSKHLYINHMDPLETVTTLFFRQISLQDQESAALKGATLCAWPDRAVSSPEDMFIQNAIYPSILSFGERIWRGKGEAEWKANIPVDPTLLSEFKEFESRLLLHKDLYFHNRPFPYVKQSGLEWNLYGPFDNQGDLSKNFSEEEISSKAAVRAIGGTVILRHWWSDVLPGAISNPRENTTWYAKTRIYSDKAGNYPFWIGFANLSRSYASDSPPIGAWDELQSAVFVNGTQIAAPNWKQGGKKGNIEQPLLDEGYSFRKPTMINLKKGWNEVVIKLPVRDFKGKDWQNPTKWMFTFVPTY